MRGGYTHIMNKRNGGPTHAEILNYFHGLLLCAYECVLYVYVICMDEYV